ncbi:MAG TPA: 1-acyl-sn-glycerol-3-phosphate acyltransferase [Thermoanaerobaculia bacterium]|nr:1-acyl-sn-glycerol-3-phosphate acyltransferase [Thermoanaerobaculia bacterium]
MIVRLIRLLLAAFYREIGVAGLERLPRGRPLLLVANHVNALVDPLLVLGTLPVRARFLAKHTLWKMPGLGPLLDVGGAIPVYRRQDEGGDAGRNVEAFAKCHEELAAGGAVALFPEGVSHNLPGLQPLKTGAARIALEAEERFGGQPHGGSGEREAGGGLGVRIVPVGLIFDVRPRFRSRAFVQVGEPIDPAPELAAFRAAAAGGDDAGARAAAVRALTARIDAGLRAATLNYASWEEARLIARAAELIGRPGLELPGRRSLEEGIELRRALLAGYRELAERCPEKVAAAAEAVRRYDRLLRALGLRDDQVAARYPPAGVARFIGHTLLRLLVHLPVALVGTVLNALPYLLVTAIARRFRHAPDQVATWKVFPSLFVYPLCWLAQGIALGAGLGRPGLGALATVAAPFTGYAALRFHETRLNFAREARAYLLLRRRGDLAGELRMMREEVYRQVQGLVEEYQAVSK